MIHIRIEQTAPRLGCLAENLEKHCDCIAQANAEGVNLLVFPELSLTGYLLKDLVPEVALSVDGLITELGKRLAGTRDFEAVIGFVEETPGHRFYNSAAFLRWDPQGMLEAVHVHRKIYLPTYGLFDEGRYFSQGRTARTFDSKFLGRCGLLICEDAWHLSVPLLLALDGPNQEGAGTFIVISNSPARGIGGETQGVPESLQTWENLLRTYACLLESMVLYANRGGVEDGLTFSGGSQMVAAGGKPLARADLFSPDTLDYTLDWPEDLRSSRLGSLVIANENADFLRRELDRILRSSI